MVRDSIQDAVFAVMPGMHGRRLAELARQLRPLKVLFVTGYAEPAAVRGSFLDAAMHMMSKPFPSMRSARIRNRPGAAA